ncbi:hypothetical protein HYDPIDRAFT_46803, partial [Hydnomerulius pinastri MD-312]
ALQRLSEWRSNIGSTALAMMIDFFAELDDDADIVEVAKALQDGYKFLQEDPDDDMEGVIALCAAAVERAVEFIADRLIDVDEVLASMADNGGKMRIKLPKVLNKATGKETSGPFMFSVSNWGTQTLAY